MKKLLHERLREAARNGVSSIETCDENIVVSLLKDEELSLADEIEKYYIPRPRFEGGEPVKTGFLPASIEWDDAGNAPYIYNGILLDGHGDIEAILAVGTDFAVSRHLDDGILKRPEPKVLDAEGVPCKKGETVWRLIDSTKWEVTDIHPTEPRIAVRQLDTEKEVVGGWFLAEEYSHREPDSLEKLRDDMNYSIVEGTYPGTAHEYLCRCAKRLTAIMERDA